MKNFISYLLLLLATGNVFGQLNPVSWSFTQVNIGNGEYDLVFTANIQKGWYVYSQYLDSEDGPVPTSFTFDADIKPMLIDKTKEEGTKHEGYDELFAMNIIKYSGKPVFTQRIKTPPNTKVIGYITFMACDDEKCLPPKDVEFEFEIK